MPNWVKQGWITDIDFEDPNNRPVEVRVLLTKRQLSDVQLVLGGILDAAKRSLVEPREFFDSIRSFAAKLGRNPDLVTDPQTTKLADLGLLDEYLQSHAMNVDQDIWPRWSVTQQNEFIKTIVGRKLRHYQIYNSDTGRWIALAEDSPPGKYVYPVPLDDLP